MSLPRIPENAVLRLREFFQDARGVFSAFTVISLLAGLTLVLAPLVCRLLSWAVLSRDEMSALTLIYVAAAFGDTLLGIYLNKAPERVAVNQQFGEGSVNRQMPEQMPETPDNEA